ncbi:hypothetical protein [Antarcticirhabdus aurantiaca]|uniref:Uncharacterized protein n=1 Tax=Antarcticirhabdus aurantiaca TaxID=2606717 RepID=A0ACD4NLH4_9HYPH|nr:hypothetical protein [Antarcticirhabdus aurantiaca]WAJ27708.1 hypothetical protein OXU80_23160 [Jeongeuplla avenae]
MAGFALKAAARLGLVVAAGIGLSGCMGPTYGTGTSAGAQLFDDLDQFADLTPNSTQIPYAPRPELVRPNSVGALPAPRSVRNTTDDPNWPESPEQRAARLRAAGDAVNNNGDTPIRGDVLAAEKEGVTDEMRAAATRNGRSSESRRLYSSASGSTTLSPTQLRSSRELIQQRVAEQRGNPNQRRYLSEPPTTYRQPAASAPVGDPGEDEEVKQRRLSNDRSSVFDKFKDLVPGM